jgi:hypothetical protein
MNLRTQKLLSDLAIRYNTRLPFSPGQPIYLYKSQAPESEIAVFDPDQPQSELIFAILYAIGHEYLHRDKKYKLPIPSFVNRPYENEFAGEVAYKTRRAIRRFCGEQWQANLWALCEYYQIGCPEEFKEFLKRHPEKAYLMWFLRPAVWKTRLINGLHNLLHGSKAAPTMR